MTQKQKIEKKGYKITYCMSGAVIANKSGKLYRAETISKLYKILFG